jgi:hypothetical protein
LKITVINGSLKTALIRGGEMPSITIKVSDEPDSKALLKEALERERKVIEQGIAKTEKNVRRLVKSLGLRASELEKLDKVERDEENELALIELEGELAILARLKDRKKNLGSMVICG